MGVGTYLHLLYLGGRTKPPSMVIYLDVIVPKVGCVRMMSYGFIALFWETIFSLMPSDTNALLADIRPSFARIEGRYDPQPALTNFDLLTKICISTIPCNCKYPISISGRKKAHDSFSFGIGSGHVSLQAKGSVRATKEITPGSQLVYKYHQPEFTSAILICVVSLAHSCMSAIIL